MWIDERYGWNSELYDDHVCIQRERNKHWYPIFELYSASEKSLFTPGEHLFLCSPPPEVAKEWNAEPGVHFFDLFQKFEILCDFDVYKFPFDTQVCSYRFSTYLFDNSTIRLMDFNVDPSSSYIPNQEWELERISKTFENKALLLASRPQNRSIMEYKIYLRRRSASYIGTIFIPTSALGILTLTIHVIPAESGEKIGLGVSVFLAFSVFQLMLVDSLPQSEKLPLVGEYFSTSQFDSQIKTCF